MFTMTIHDSTWKILAHGQSRTGEGWQETFLRLYQSSLESGSPKRRFAVKDNLVEPSGTAIRSTITAYTDEEGQVKTDPPVIIHTRPAQF